MEDHKALVRRQLGTEELTNLVGDDERRWIKYEDELDAGFAAKVAKMAHGEKFFTCIQCGTCSATCPVSHYMDLTPRKIIAMVREGFKDEVLGSFTIWLCASCYSCTSDCPRKIRITDVMYALRQMAIAEGVYPKRFPIPIMAKEFFRHVARDGRNSEGRLMLSFSLKTNPIRGSCGMPKWAGSYGERGESLWARKAFKKKPSSMPCWEPLKGRRRKPQNEIYVFSWLLHARHRKARRGIHLERFQSTGPSLGRD